MTKKQYLQPEIAVEDIQLNTVILVSPTGDDISLGGGLDPNYAN